MDFIFIKSSKKGKEDFGSIYARVRTGKANLKVVTGFTIKQLEWEKYRSLQYSSSALMSSIGIKYGQFAQVLARIKTAFEADGFNPKEAKSIIESVKHDVLNGMMQIVEVKPKGRMLFEDYLTSYIEDMELGRRTKKGRTVKVSPAYIKGLRIILGQIRNYQKEMHRKLGLDDMTMETRNSLVGYWKERGLMPNAINSYMTDVRTVAKAAYEDKLTKCDDFCHSDFVPKKEDVDNIYLTPEQIQEMLEEKRRAGTGKELGRTLYKEYSVEKFLQVVEEIRIEVWNLWIPYWQQHCCLYAAPECFDEDGPPPKIYNDLTKEFLVDQEQNIWEKKPEWESEQRMIITAGACHILAEGLKNKEEQDNG